MKAVIGIDRRDQSIHLAIPINHGYYYGWGRVVLVKNGHEQVELVFKDRYNLLRFARALYDAVLDDVINAFSYDIDHDISLKRLSKFINQEMESGV